MFAKKCLFGCETWHHVRLAPEEQNNEAPLPAVQDLQGQWACPSALLGTTVLLPATGGFVKN